MNEKFTPAIASEMYEALKKIGGMKERYKHMLDYVRSIACNDESEKVHWIAVANYFDHDEERFIVGLFHDVVEDGYRSIADLDAEFNLNVKVKDAIDAISRRQGENYFKYIERVKKNPLATEVKIADLRENINRCVAYLPNRWSLLGRYAKAYGALIGQLDLEDC